MGTITVYEYTTIGGAGSVGLGGAPVYNLKTLIARTQDASTTTTAENITLNENTRFVRIEAEELHRVSLGENNTADAGVYEEIQPSSEVALGRDFAVRGGEALYYRSDA